MKIDAAFGWPASLGEDRLLAALKRVNDNFDDDPPHMHAVLGPPGPVRWFTFAYSQVRYDRTLVQDHFAEWIGEPRLLVVTRTFYGEDPHVARCGELKIAAFGPNIHVYGVLPAHTRRDGEVDQILLDALGLGDARRPFVDLAKPTHEVVLREDRKRVRVEKIIPLARPVLQETPGPGSHDRIHDGGDLIFLETPRAIDGDVAALEKTLEALSVKVEKDWIQNFDRDFAKHVDSLVQVGPRIAPALVAFLGRAGNKTRTARLALAALGKLGTGGEAMIAWAAKPSELPSQAGFAALIALGEAARPAIAIARASNKPTERAVGEAVAMMLDGSEWAPVRAARSSLLYRKLVGTESTGYNDPVETANPDELWAVAAYFIDVPNEWWGRSRRLHYAVERAGAGFGPIADLLLRYPPFADDVQLAAIARGDKLPTVEQVRTMAKKRGVKARSGNKPTRATKRSPK